MLHYFVTMQVFFFLPDKNNRKYRGEWGDLAYGSVGSIEFLLVG
jgi:hypothetical protein